MSITVNPPGGRPELRHQSVLNLSEAARSLGIAQAKNDAEAIDYWTGKVRMCEAALTANRRPVDLEQFRPPVEEVRANTMAYAATLTSAGRCTTFEKAKIAELDRLLILIAVGDGAA